MLKNEAFRIFASRNVVVFIIFAILLNFFQIYYLQKKNLSNSGIEEYRTVWETVEEKCASIGPDYTREWLATDAIESVVDEEKAVYRYVLDEYNRIMEYDTYLSELIDYSQKMMSVSIFSKKDSFSYRNIKCMLERYETMKESVPTPAPSLGFECATNSETTDFIAVATIIYICILLWLRDREGNALVLIRTTPVGRTRLVWDKLFILALFVFFLNLFLNGGSLLGGELIYGLGDLNRELVSVPAYRASVLKVTAGEYIVLFMVCKYVSYLVVSLFISAVFCLSSTILNGFAGVIVAAAVSAGFYYSIAATSVWQAFKYINLYGLMRTEDYLGNYININIFRHPVELGICIIVLGVLLMVAGVVTTVKTFVCLRNTTVKSGRVGKMWQNLKERLAGFGIKHTGVFRHEAQKIFFTYGAFWVLIVFAGVQIWDGNNVKPEHKDDVGYYYSAYMRMLEGEVTEEKEEFLRSERKNTDDKDKRRAADRVLDKIEYLKESGGYILYEGGWNSITGANYREDLICVVFLFVAMILTLSAVFSADRQYGIYNLITTTPKGRRLLQSYRLIIGFIISVMVLILTYCFRWYQIWEKNGLAGRMLSYPACSLEHLSKFSTDISLGEYVVMLVLVRLFAVIAGSCVLYYISGIIGSLSRTYIAMIIVMVLPTVMVMEKKNLLGLYYPWAFFAGNLALSYPAWKLMMLALIYVAMMVFCIYGVCRKKRT